MWHPDRLNNSTKQSDKTLSDSGQAFGTTWNIWKLPAGGTMTMSRADVLITDVRHYRDLGKRGVKFWDRNSVTFPRRGVHVGIGDANLNSRFKGFQSPVA